MSSPSLQTPRSLLGRWGTRTPVNCSPSTFQTGQKPLPFGGPWGGIGSLLLSDSEHGGPVLWKGEGCIPGWAV